MHKAYWEILGIVIVVVVLLGGKACHANWAYGDWTCGFKNCRVISEGE